MTTASSLMGAFGDRQVETGRVDLRPILGASSLCRRLRLREVQRRLVQRLVGRVDGNRRARCQSAPEHLATRHSRERSLRRSGRRTRKDRGESPRRDSASGRPRDRGDGVVELPSVAPPATRADAGSARTASEDARPPIHAGGSCHSAPGRQPAVGIGRSPPTAAECLQTIPERVAVRRTEAAFAGRSGSWSTGS